MASFPWCYMTRSRESIIKHVPRKTNLISLTRMRPALKWATFKCGLDTLRASRHSSVQPALTSFPTAMCVLPRQFAAYARLALSCLISSTKKVIQILFAWKTSAVLQATATTVSKELIRNLKLTIAVKLLLTPFLRCSTNHVPYVLKATTSMYLASLPQQVPKLLASTHAESKRVVWQGTCSLGLKSNNSYINQVIKMTCTPSYWNLIEVSDSTTLSTSSSKLSHWSLTSKKLARPHSTITLKLLQR